MFAPRSLVFALIAAAAFGAAAQAQDLAGDAGAVAQVFDGAGVAVPVPSGQPLQWLDAIWNVPGPDGLTARFRFLAPAIAPGGTVDFDTASADMQALCDQFAVPRIADLGPQPQQIIISLSDRPVTFGEPAPDATQFFESYRLENGTCQWEMF